MMGRYCGIGLGLFLSVAPSLQAQVIYQGCVPAFYVYPYCSYPFTYLESWSTPAVPTAIPSPRPIAEPQLQKPLSPSKRPMPPAAPPEPKAEKKPETQVEKKPEPQTEKKPEPQAEEKPVAPTPAAAPAPLVAPTPEKRAPAVTESRFPGNATEPTTKARCRVGFWNLSGRDVTLTVDGQPRPLGKERALTLELPLRFVWQVDQTPARTEQVPTGQSTHEIVIRE